MRTHTQGNHRSTLMLALRMLLAARRLRDVVMPRRVMDVWLATGAVPVAHMVADLDEIDASDANGRL